MSYDPFDPSYDPPTGGGREKPLTDEESVMMGTFNRVFTSMTRFYKVIREPKTVKAIKESTKLFKTIGKVGKFAKTLAKSLEFTQALMGMPTKTAIQGLDMLTAQLVGPISGAITQTIGQLSASLNQILGPALQQIGQAMGGFVRANPIGAGIGGTIGGIAGAVTGIPGLGIVGGIIGGGIEALGKGLQAISGSLGTIDESENLADIRNLTRYVMETGNPMPKNPMMNEAYMQWWFSSGKAKAGTPLTGVTAAAMTGGETTPPALETLSVGGGPSINVNEGFVGGTASMNELVTATGVTNRLLSKIVQIERQAWG